MLRQGRSGRERTLVGVIAAIILIIFINLLFHFGQTVSFAPPNPHTLIQHSLRDWMTFTAQRFTAGALRSVDLPPPASVPDASVDASRRCVLLVGGAGYIGAHVAKYIARRGWTPVVLDNLVRGYRSMVRFGPFYEGSISDSGLLHKIFQKHDIFAVMHFAAFAYVGESVQNPSIYYHNNIAETLFLLDSMLQHGVYRFILSSTCATYGIPEVLPITEDAPQKPINPYGRSKLFLEHTVRDYAVAYPQLQYGFLRYFNAAGGDPDGEVGEFHRPETHLIPLVLAAALGHGKPVGIYGTDHPTKDGSAVRDYIHVNDLAQAHLLGMLSLDMSGADATAAADGGVGGAGVAHHDAHSHGATRNVSTEGGGVAAHHDGAHLPPAALPTASFAFNLGNGRGYSVKEVIAVAEKVTKRKVPYVEKPRRAGDPPELVGSGEAAKRHLGWKPEFSDLESIIAHAWQWLEYQQTPEFARQHPDLALLLNESGASNII